MQNLIDFVIKHTERGSCQCGKCIDAPLGEPSRPAGHTVNLCFFEVSATGEPNKEKLVELVKELKFSDYPIDLFDNQPHNFMEIGAAIGDQGLAMQLMGLGTILNLWELFTPNKVLAKAGSAKQLSSSDEIGLAGMGWLYIKTRTQQ